MQEYKRIDIGVDDIVPIAEKMKKEGRRLVMIHGYIDTDGQAVVSYDYEVGSCIESYNITGVNKLPSIEKIYDTSAQWPERELHELIGLEFEGLDTSKRLFLPDSMLEGVGQIIVSPMDDLKKMNQRTEGK